jgi:hypothetical protein
MQRETPMKTTTEYIKDVEGVKDVHGVRGVKNNMGGDWNSGVRIVKRAKRTASPIKSRKLIIKGVNYANKRRVQQAH